MTLFHLLFSKKFYMFGVSSKSDFEVIYIYVLAFILACLNQLFYIFKLFIAGCDVY